MMDLDSAIQHCEEVAEEQKKEANEWHENQVRKCELFPLAEMDYTHENECKKCAEEHRQLAEWLKELKDYRKTWDAIKKQIKEESDFAYADFDKYKYEVLGVDDIDELPDDVFRYGMERALEIINEYIRVVKE